MPVAKTAAIRASTLDTLVSSLNRQFGPGTVVKGSEVTDLFPRITTGSLGLDLITGGGWPSNQWSEIIGENSSGKTAVCFKTIAANQQKDPNFTAAWIAGESFVPSYARMCGVDVDRVVVINTGIMEEAYDAAIQAADSRQIDLIVIDSLPALTPLSEDEGKMDDFQVGRGALLTGKFFRKVGKATKRELDGTERPITGIVINQWRSKIGVMHGDPRTSPGGQGKDYAYFLKLDVRRSEWIELGSGADKERVGQCIAIRTTKNKTAPPQQVAYVDFYFKDKEGGLPPGSYDFAKEVASLAILEGIVTRGGSWFKYEGEQWQGVEKFQQAVREEVDLYERLSKEVADVMSVVLH